MTIEDKNVALRQGECIIIPPSYRHSFMVDGMQKCQITQFGFKLLEVNEKLDCLILLKSEQPYFKITNCTDVLENMNNLYTYSNYSSYAEYNKLLFNMEVQKLFILLSMHIDRMSLIKQKCENKLLEAVLSYMDNHYEQDIHIEALARTYKISSRYLRRLFMDQVGFSAVEYMTMLRIERAKDLLKNTSVSIPDIAMNVGYNSFQYFSLIFKKKTGVSPKDFRNQYRMK